MRAPVTRVASPFTVGQRPGADDDPLGVALRDHPLLPRLVPEVEGQDHGDDEERVVEPHAAGAVSDAERGLADEAPCPVSLHRPQDVSRPLRENAGREEVLPVAERAEHRLLAPHGFLDGGRVEHVALDDGQPRVRDRKPRRISHERRDREDRAPGPARRADDPSRRSLRRSGSARASGEPPRSRSPSANGGRLEPSRRERTMAYDRKSSRIVIAGLCSARGTKSISGAARCLVRNLSPLLRQAAGPRRPPAAGARGIRRDPTRRALRRG